MRLGHVAREGAIFLCFLLLALVETYPLALHLATHLPYSLHDPGEVLTRLEWERWSLLHDPRHFFDGFIFYGVPGAQFLTNLALGGLLIYLPVRELGGSPVLAFNLAHLLGLALIAWCAYRAARSLGLDRTASAAAGVIWTFGLPQLGLYTGLEWTMTWWVPLALWALISFVRRPSAVKIGVAVVSLWMTLATHIYSVFMAGFFAVFLLLAAVTWRTFPWRWLRAHVLRVAVVVAVATLPFLPIAAGFFQVPQKWSEPRSIWYARFYALEPLDYLAPPAGSAWYAAWLGPLFSRAGKAEAVHQADAAFPGLLPPLLGVVGLVWALRRRRCSADRRLAAVATASAAAVVAGFVLSLGPEFIWRDRPSGVMLPFTWLHDVFAPLQALRAVGRFSYLLVAGLALLAALGVAALRRWPRAASWGPALSLGAVLLLAVETLHAPLELFPIETLVPSSPVNRFLKTLSPAPLIFVPVEAPSEPWPEARRMYWAVTSGPFPIVNGSSAIYPASYWDLQRLTDNATPSDLASALNVYRDSGIRYVVVERPRVDAWMNNRWGCAFAADAAARVVYADEQAIVADLGPRPTTGIQVGATSLRADLLQSRVPADSGLDMVVDVAGRDASQMWQQSAAPAAPFRDLQLTWRPVRADGTVAPAPVAGGRRQAVLRRLGAIMSWLAPKSSEFVVQRQLVLPTFLRPGESKALIVHSFTPAAPGLYEIAAAVDGVPWATWRVQVSAGDSAPKPSQSPGGLGARLRAANVVTDVFAGERADIDVVAENTGTTLWDGQVRLAYRWARIDPATGTAAELPDLMGRIFLGTDTPPGYSYHFADRITTPAEPGSYRLTISMLAEGIIWFDQMTPPGTQPLVYDVTVRQGEDSPPCAIPAR